MSNSKDEYIVLKLFSITNLMDINLSKLWKLVVDRESWHVAVHGIPTYIIFINVCSKIFTQEAMFSGLC